MKSEQKSTNSNISRRIRVRRSLLGYSQEKLSNITTIDIKKIRAYETDKKVCPYDLHKISKALEVPMEYFFFSHSDFKKQDKNKLMIVE